jgi:DNA-binding transcriptional LysR family regulator
MILRAVRGGRRAIIRAMEIKWLEDFVSLAETHSFSRSAELRHVTQPAFSRRIQSLEAWVGTELIDRSSYPTSLTAAGKVFYEQALAMLAQVSETRALMRGQRSANAQVLEFAVPHTLSLTFFPEWLKGVERKVGTLPCRLRALNVHDAVLMLVEGGCDLVMVYHHSRQAIQLDPAHYDMLVLGTERLSPYSVPDASGRPLFRLPGTDKKPVPFLSYTPNAFLGRMVDMLLAESPETLKLDKCYETDMAEALKVMALAGHGMAFLPEARCARTWPPAGWYGPMPRRAAAVDRHGNPALSRTAAGTRQRAARQPAAPQAPARGQGLGGADLVKNPFRGRGNGYASLA